MDPYWTRNFTAHRMNLDTVQAYREHEGDDAAELQSQGLADSRWAWAVLLALSVAAVACAAAITLFWPGA